MPFPDPSAFSSSLARRLVFGENPVSLHGFFQTAAERTAVVLACTLPYSVSVVNIVCCWLLFTWVMADRYRDRWNTLRKSPWVLWNVLFFLLLGIGIFYSSVAFQDALRIWISYLNTLLLIVLALIFQNERRRWQAFLFFSVALGGRILWNIFYECAYCLPKNHGYGMFFNDYNVFALFLLIWIVTLIHVPIERRIFSILRWGLIAALVFILLWKTHSRTGSIALFVVFVVAFWQFYSWKGMIFAILTAVVLGCSAYYFIPNFHDRFSRILQALEHTKKIDRTSDSLSSAETRWLIYRDGFKLAKKRPLLGYGTGGIGIAYKKNDHLPTENAHSEYLQVMLQLGLLGLAVFGIWLISLWRRARELPSLHRQRTAELFVVLFLVACLFLTVWSDAVSGYAVAFFLAWSLAAPNAADAEIDTPSEGKK